VKQIDERVDRSVFAPIEDAIADIAAGRIVIVVDDADRENEGDFVMAAERATPEAINFMVTHGRGIVCLPTTAQRLDELHVPPMVSQNNESHGTAFAVSIDIQGRTTTGTSAFDRAATVRAVADLSLRPEDVRMPGHVFPLRARQGGVLRRAGHTEAAVDLARLAGLFPAGVLCEVLHPDGSMARLPELVRVAREHQLKLISIADLIEHCRNEALIRRVADATIPTPYGEFRAAAYDSGVDHVTHVALVLGEIGDGRDVLVRVHSECLTGDVFGSLRCDCGDQLALALGMIAAEGRGVLVYLRGHEGRAIGLTHKLRAYELQEVRGLDTVEANEELGFVADPRDYSAGVRILADLGVRSMRLLTNNPSKRAGLERDGLRIVDRVALEVPARQENIGYLRTKREKLGHLLEHLEGDPADARAAERS
jgi:3,4-dihydroxy 2-butanone 4-phosphate synthase/GTP cyclohydrolase II